MVNDKTNWKRERANIIKLLKKETNVRVIAEAYGCTFQNMYLVIEKLGIDVRSIRDVIRLDKQKKRIEANKYARKMAFLTKYSYLSDEIIQPKNLRTGATSTEGMSKKVIAAREATRNYRNRERLKVFARNILRRGIIMGYIVKGVCADCGSLEHIEAHHTDYRYPFKVTWLCRDHHWERHTEGGN